MMDQSNTRILGAFVLGFAIVGGALVLKNFTTAPAPQGVGLQAEPPRAALEARAALAVSDSDNNGIEDWRDQFVKNSPIVIATTTDDTYTPPDTLTGQVGISLVENLIRSEGQGAFGPTQEQIIADTLKRVSVYGTDTIFDIRNIKISQDTSNEAIRAYGNAMADAIVDNSVPGLRHELLILRDLVNQPTEEGVAQLATIAKVYSDTRDEMLAIPVPVLFVKEHLDLINVFHALSNDIETMSSSLDDPMLALIRLKRYEDDAEGLRLALKNMFLVLEPYASAFEQNDSAILFVAFSPTVQ